MSCSTSVPVAGAASQRKLFFLNWGRAAMRVLKTAPGEVIDVAFSPDCRAIAAAVERPHLAANIFLWNLDSPTISPVRLETNSYGRGGLGFSASARQLGWFSDNGQCRIYDRDTRTETLTDFPRWSAHGYDTSCDATGTLAVSHHRFPQHSLRAWKLIENEWIRQWQVSTRDLYVGSLTLAPTGDRFAMFTGEGEESITWRLEIRAVATAALLITGSYPYSYAGKLAFHPQGEQIVGLNDMTLLAWPLPDGGEPRLLRNDSRKHFTALAYHPNGRQLFVTSNDKTVHVFDTQTLDRINRYTWQLDQLSTIALSADGTLAAAGSANGDVVVWDLE
jgi:WD40 repeat protein